MASSSSVYSTLINEAKKFIPPLSAKLHKGQAGRVGVVGGSADYTGAPYFSALASMKIGADLAHVICEPTAGAVIKTYSPDLIVHTILDSTSPPSRETLKSLISRLHVLVIGPGLGRDDAMQGFGRDCLDVAKELQKWVVLDADGLWMVTEDPKIIEGYDKAILTPNVMENKRLCEKMGVDSKATLSDMCHLLAASLGNVTILQKGPTDIVSNGLPISYLPSQPLIAENELQGGLKRCGGQGDILSGTVGVLAGWAGMWGEGDYNDVTPTPPGKDQKIPPLGVLAAYAASSVTRQASRLAFEKHGRSMQTSDVMLEVGHAFETVLGESSGAQSESKL